MRDELAGSGAGLGVRGDCGHWLETGRLRTSDYGGEDGRGKRGIRVALTEGDGGRARQGRGAPVR